MATIQERLKRVKNMRLKAANDNKTDLQALTTVQPESSYKRTKLLNLEEKLELGEVESERIQSLNYSIQDFDNWDGIQVEKKRRETKGHTDYNQVANKKYLKMTNQIKPDIQTYRAKSNLVTDNILDINDATPVPSSSVDKMVNDLKDQISKRENLSKRRAYNDDDDVTYINERNRHFNKKIARAYDKYTKDIKDSFERGTALE